MFFKASFFVLLLASNLHAKEGVMSMKETIQDKVVFKKETKSVNVLFSEGFKVVGIGLLKSQFFDAMFASIIHSLIEFESQMKY